MHFSASGIRTSPTAGRFSSRPTPKLAVYVQWGPRAADDLRHELTHAYLHSVVPKLPLWLDEGLAKYFEIPPGRHGLNPQYVQQIAAAMEKGVWHPNLRRLEQIPPTADMSQEDYVEAWAWVHFLLESQPACADVLRQYLADLRGGKPGRAAFVAFDRLGRPPGMGIARTRPLIGSPRLRQMPPARLAEAAAGAL